MPDHGDQLHDSGPWTTVVPAWVALKSAIADILRDDSNAIGDTSDALTTIAAQYAATDHAAATRFTSLQQDDTSEQGWSVWPSPTT